MNLINKNLSTAFLLPVYNSEILLSKTLDSLFKQDYKDFKIYIINNGSSDNTEFLLKKYANYDSRIISFKASTPPGYVTLKFSNFIIKHKNNRIEFNQSGYLQYYSSYNPNSSAACLTTSNSELTAGTRPVHP